MAILSPAASPVRAQYPVHVDADGPPAPSRWLWLVKWLLVIPHVVVLGFLWTAFAALSVVAFVAILLTGRYPRGIFDFNVGVLRWTWRVAYYSYGALATDVYPPFTVAEVADYPAHLHVDYPEHLSRGLALVKWWLLALPHYVVVAIFVGTGARTVQLAADTELRWESAGLIGLLVLIAAVALAVTGSYPRSLYDLVLGLNRWVLRVTAYAALMTDAYPPFRLDLGDHDGGSLSFARAPTAQGPSAVTGALPAAPTTAPPGARPPAGPSGSRTGTLVLGVLLLVLGGGGVVAGATAGIGQLVGRDGAYLTGSAWDVSTPGYAVVAGDVTIHAPDGVERWINDLLGEVQVTASSAGDREIFLGVTTREQAERYLTGVASTTVLRPRATAVEQAGGPPATAPGSVDIWAAEATGTGTQRITVEADSGSWVAVIMPADGRPGMDAELGVGVTAPWLPRAAGAAVLVGLLLVGAGAALVNSRTPTGRPRAPVQAH